MSHFTVLVIGNDVEGALAPFHEFECTGVDDQYIQDIDETVDTLERYQSGTTARVRDNATGALYPAYDDQFFHALPDDKGAEILALPHHKRPDGTHIRGGKACTYELPEGYEKVEVPYTEIMSFLDYVKRDTDENRVVEFGKQPDLKEHHKYGYVLLSEEGEVEKVICRTNPDKWKWIDEKGQEIAITYGQESLPFLQPVEGCPGQFLLDEEGRLLHLLQGLHEAEQQASEDAGAEKTLASKGDLWPGAGGLQSNVVGAERKVQDMQERPGAENSGLCGGSLSFDWPGKGASLHALQHFARSCERRHIYLRPTQTVSGRITKQFISGAKWDWYQIGGRWSGFFKKKPEAIGLLGNRSWMNAGEEIPEDRADQVTKVDVDFEGMMSEAGAEAAAKFDLYIQHFGDKEGNFIPWDKVRTDFDAEGKTIEEARQFYHSQPLKLAIAGYLKTHDRKGDTPEAKLSSWLLWNSPEEMLTGQGTIEKRREQYIELARVNSIMTFAVLKDGQWYERGSMGWWGCVSDEKDKLEWANQYLSLIENLPDDTLLTVVDCHI